MEQKERWKEREFGGWRMGDEMDWVGLGFVREKIMLDLKGLES